MRRISSPGSAFSTLRLAAGLLPCSLGAGLALFALNGRAPSREGTGAAAPSGASPVVATAAFAKLPLSFEPNERQTDASVKFLARGPGYTLLIKSTETVLSLRQGRGRPPAKLAGPIGQPTAPAETRTALLRIKLLGSNPDPRMNGVARLPGYSNYLIGNDPAHWKTHIPHYARVQSESIYPGIDLVYYGDRRQLEYDFVVAPGADPRAIRFGVEGANDLYLDAAGSLVAAMEGGNVIQPAPLIYQEVGGKRQRVEGEYELTAQGEVGFRVAAYDQTKPLVIDPMIIFSSYLGSNLEDAGIGIATDAAGNAYVTGGTGSINLDETTSDFPTTPNAFQPDYNGFFDAYVTKFSADGSTLLYSTFLGGAGADGAYGIAVDATGNAYVTGNTSSPDFPSVNAAQPAIGGHLDCFITKLNPDGSAIVYSTFLGGGLDFLGGTSGAEVGFAIAVDPAGFAYIAGNATSIDFPTVNAVQPAHSGGFDGIAAKLTPDGSAFVFATYLGGAELDSAEAIAADAEGNAYLTGTAFSANFPVVNAFQPANGAGADCPDQFGCPDAFVAKFDPTGGLSYSTLLGGELREEGRGIAVDPTGNVYLSGFVTSTDFPTTAGAHQTTQRGALGNAFVTKFNPTGSALVYSTYFGGSTGEAARALALDSAGNVYLTGEAVSADFPAVRPIQAAIGGLTDAFVAKLNAAGSDLIYATVLGGLGDDFGRGIAVDAAQNVYVTGQTLSSNFPTVNPVQAERAGNNTDGFVVKISDTRDCQYFPPPIGQVCDLLPAPPRPTGAGSRKLHGAADAFEIDLPLTGDPGIECRYGGSAGVHEMIVRFAAAVTCNSAQVTSGTGSASSFSVSPDGKEITVNLTGVTNEQRIAVTLNVSDGTNSGDIIVPMEVLLGDVDASRRVDGGDVLITRQQNFKPLGEENFTADVNASGRIDGGDTLITRQQNFERVPTVRRQSGAAPR